jgi:hypothetical protein
MKTATSAARPTQGLCGKGQLATWNERHGILVQSDRQQAVENHSAGLGQPLSYS